MRTVSVSASSSPQAITPTDLQRLVCCGDEQELVLDRLHGLPLVTGLSRPEPVRVVPARQLSVRPGNLRLGRLPGDTEHVVADLGAAVEALHQRGDGRQAGDGEEEHGEPSPCPRRLGTPAEAAAAATAATPLRVCRHLGLVQAAANSSPGTERSALAARSRFTGVIDRRQRKRWFV